MSTDRYLLDYLRQSGRIHGAYFESLRYEFDKRIYHYGAHFNVEYAPTSDLNNVKREIYQFVRSVVKGAYGYSEADIQSNAYSKVNVELRKLGYSVILPTWHGGILSNAQYVRKTVRSLERYFSKNNFNMILSDECSSLVEAVEASLRTYYKRIRALMIPYDIVFFENLSIKLFREAGKPSFVFLHGLPGRYNSIDDQRADHLLVWGSAIKDHYVRAGGNPASIHVVGRPGMPDQPRPLRTATFDNVLVLTKSIPGAQPITGETHLSDRGNLILYLYMIQDALRSLGVRQARFRPHPSENGRWYLKYIDTSFYRLDSAPLRDSLESSTLVIGPTTTVFLDALYAGREYCVFEPSDDGIDLINYSLVPPFDGSDPRVPVATDVDTLRANLRECRHTVQAVLDDYIARPFDLSILKTIIP